MSDEKLRGVIEEALPNTQFRVSVEGTLYLCYLAGKMRHNRIMVAIGDCVEFVYPRGSSVGRITRRF